MTTAINLDQKAAQYAQKIVQNSQLAGTAKEVENLVTKTLGVLQEQGVYACLLFLFSRTSKEKEIAPHIRQQLYDLLQELPAFTNKKQEIQALGKAKAENVLKFYSDNVCSDLYTLLLVKDLYEQTLIYARYGAKAAQKEES